MSQYSGDANAASKYKNLRGPATKNFAKEPERYLESMIEEIKDALAHAGRVKGMNIMKLVLSTREYAADPANTAPPVAPALLGELRAQYPSHREYEGPVAGHRAIQKHNEDTEYALELMAELVEDIKLAMPTAIREEFSKMPLGDILAWLEARFPTYKEAQVKALKKECTEWNNSESAELNFVRLKDASRRVLAAGFGTAMDQYMWMAEVMTKNAVAKQLLTNFKEKHPAKGGTQTFVNLMTYIDAHIADVADDIRASSMVSNAEAPEGQAGMNNSQSSIEQRLMVHVEKRMAEMNRAYERTCNREYCFKHGYEAGHNGEDCPQMQNDYYTDEQRGATLHRCLKNSAGENRHGNETNL